jgi:ribosomal protein S18 acetylase RimI-like enzyme
VKKLVDLYQTELGQTPRDLDRDEFNKIAFADWFTLVHVDIRDKIDGIITARNKNDGFIRMLMVAPNARGQGVGCELLDEVIRQLPKASLYVDSVNHNYKKLLETYKRRGFVITEQDIGGSWMKRNESIFL